MTTNNFPHIGYKTQGIDWNFFQSVTVDGYSFGSQSQDGYQPFIIIKFPTQGLLLLNEGTGIVQVSFNGNTVHDELDSTKASAGIAYDNRVVSMIWFRLKNAGAPCIVSVRAWSTR